MQLSNQVLITKVKDPTTASATGNISSDVLDMANYEGVVFFTSVGTASSSNSMKAVAGTSSGSVGDLTGTAVAVASSDEDLWLDIHRPRLRYIGVVVTREAATKCGDIWAIQYGGRVKPEDNTTPGTITGEAWVSPSTGTA